MAAFMKRVLQGTNTNITIIKSVGFLHYSNVTHPRHFKPRARPKPITRSQFDQGTRIEATGESLAAKGFLRPLKEYNPPTNTVERFNAICNSVLGQNVSPDTEIPDPETRFKLFQAFFQEFKHGIPNSLLRTMETLGDVQEFYQTPVNSTVPLEVMKNVDLPPNLHIQYEYHRFHPESDTMFGGVTAFPKSSTVVTGLKYKKKYKGHTAKTSWP